MSHLKILLKISYIVLLLRLSIKFKQFIILKVICLVYIDSYVKFCIFEYLFANLIRKWDITLN